jgi:hypothetical protein
MIIGAPILNHCGPYRSNMSANVSASHAFAKAEKRNIKPKIVVLI